MLGFGIPLTRDVDEARHGVEQANIVATFRQPESVGPGSAADVEHDAGRIGKVAQDQLAAARFLEAEDIELETGLFRRLVIIIPDSGIEVERKPIRH